jgi:hypothetical protein
VDIPDNLTQGGRCGLGKQVVVARAVDADRPSQVIADNLGNRVRDEA